MALTRAAIGGHHSNEHPDSRDRKDGRSSPSAGRGAAARRGVIDRLCSAERAHALAPRRTLDATRCPDTSFVRIGVRSRTRVQRPDADASRLPPGLRLRGDGGRQVKCARTDPILRTCRTRDRIDSIHVAVALRRPRRACLGGAIEPGCKGACAHGSDRDGKRDDGDAKSLC